MRVAPPVLALALLATGCLGSQTTFSEGTGGPPTPRTSLLLSQPLQTLASTRRAARAQCPAEYRESLCRVVWVPHVFPLQWALRYDRDLECGPDKGSYVDASRA